MSTRSVSIQVWDRQGALKSCDGVGLDALGLSPVELEEMPAQVRRALAGERFAIAISKGERKLELRLRPLYAPSGEIAGASSELVDVSEHEHLRASLAQRVAFEQLVTRLSSHFAALSSRSSDAGIDYALSEIGRFADVDRAYIFRFSSDGATTVNTHEWCADGIEPQIQELQALPLDVIPWWTLHLRWRETIHVPRVADLPEEAAAERELLEAQQVRSVLAMPMIHEQTVVGFLGFDSVRAEKAWAEDDIALLRLVGEMFVGALERARMRDLEQELVHARSLENVARLAGGVAHDFNNLLAIILNCAALLQRRVADPEPLQLVDDIYDSAKRASELTRQLLQVAHRDVTAPVVLDVNEVIRALAPIVKHTVGESIEIDVDLAPDLALVRIGLPQLEQVVLNLAVNARDAMPRGGKLSVRTAVVDIDERQAARFIDVVSGRHVLLTVRDDGVGMEPAVASRAFEPFFTTKAGAGTGLGLATVYGIVKQAGGHVALESQVGEGTVAKIYLPTAEGVAPGPNAYVARAEVMPEGKGETVLLVEDSPKLRALVRTVLTERNYCVLDAATPTVALRILEEHAGAVALLLTDVILPQMSGRELATRARDLHGLGRVVYMSGYDDDVVAHHGVLEQGVHFVAKPFLEADLLREVRRAIDDVEDSR